MSLKIPRRTYWPFKPSATPRSVASLVCFNNRRNWIRLDLPDEFVPKNPVTLPKARSACAHVLKFSRCSCFSMSGLQKAQLCFGSGTTGRTDPRRYVFEVSPFLSQLVVDERLARPAFLRRDQVKTFGKKAGFPRLRSHACDEACRRRRAAILGGEHAGGMLDAFPHGRAIVAGRVPAGPQFAPRHQTRPTVQILEDIGNKQGIEWYILGIGQRDQFAGYPGVEAIGGKPRQCHLCFGIEICIKL